MRPPTIPTPRGAPVRTLLLVTGAPSSGKTTLAVPLARHLGLPLITKDTIKEALFDTLGTGDHTWSTRLGAASFQVMFALARHSPAAVLEANFYPATPRSCKRSASSRSRSSATAP